MMNNNTVCGNAHYITLRKEKTDFPNVKADSAESAAAFVRQFYGSDIGIYESFFILLLNYSHVTIGYAKISQGGTVGTVVDPVLVAKYAIEGLAKGVILAHNHPSGNLKASQADKDMTEKIKKALALFEIKVLDHIILTEDGFTSFVNEGLMSFW